MTRGAITYTGGSLFDGRTLHQGVSAQFQNGVLTSYLPHQERAISGDVIALDGDILAPGYVDLQVNGGDGVMFNDDPSTETLRRMANAHRRLGATRILPTLITDSRDVTDAAIQAATAAVADGVRGVAGLHLEGPHLSIARKGAHDAQFIRPMEEADLQALMSAKRALPVLKVTLAPETVSLEQVSRLANAGVLVSLGHSNVDFDTGLAYAQAGARCVTHLFNAMSQLGSRQPGLAGTALASGQLSAGLIADGVHVHPAVMRMAWRSKAAPGKIFLVSDAMAVAGTEANTFRLNGRAIARRDGQLRLADGTLAGADLDLTRAVSVLVRTVDVPIEAALAAATSTPAKLCLMPDQTVRAGVTKLDDMIRIASDLSGAVPLVA